MRRAASRCALRECARRPRGVDSTTPLTLPAPLIYASNIL